MTSSCEIESRLTSVRERIAAAAARVGREPEEITLLGVAKRKRAELIVAAVRAGLRDLAENYVQEAVAKIPTVNAGLEREGLAAPRWHFVGQLQRNKARDVVRLFDVRDVALYVFESERLVEEGDGLVVGGRHGATSAQ